MDEMTNRKNQETAGGDSGARDEMLETLASLKLQMDAMKKAQEKESVARESLEAPYRKYGTGVASGIFVAVLIGLWGIGQSYVTEDAPRLLDEWLLFYRAHGYRTPAWGAWTNLFPALMLFLVGGVVSFWKKIGSLNARTLKHYKDTLSFEQYELEANSVMRSERKDKVLIVLYTLATLAVLGHTYAEAYGEMNGARHYEVHMAMIEAVEPYEGKAKGDEFKSRWVTMATTADLEAFKRDLYPLYYKAAAENAKLRYTPDPSGEPDAKPVPKKKVSPSPVAATASE